MSALTAALYTALVIYLGGWLLGYWVGNFALLLFLMTVVTLAYWLAERFHFKPERMRAAARLEEQDAARRAELARMGIEKIDGNSPRPRRGCSPSLGGWTGRQACSR